MMQLLRDSRPKKSLLLFVVTIVIAAGLSLLPGIHEGEEDLGLSWLFHARGVRPAPPQVVVISIDKSSSGHFNLPNLANKWPRSLHTRLLDKLSQAGAKVIVFDVHFKEQKQAQQDLELAQAIKNAGNVVLFEFLQKQVVETQDSRGLASQFIIDELIPPFPALANAAVALAPNPLPKVPVKVSQFWKFVPEAGDVATLPVLAYQLYRPEQLMLFIKVLEPLIDTKLSRYYQDDIINKKMLPELMKVVHELFLQKPDLRQQVLKAIESTTAAKTNKQQMRKLLELYSGRASQYINYYGPARSITTIPYYEVLESDQHQAMLKDKLVFVGFSEHRQWEQQDGFYSVYSSKEGLDISGVEITAVAAANLLEGIAVKPMTLGMHMLMLLLVTIVLVLIYKIAHGIWLPVMLMVAGGLYFLMSLQLFASSGLWLPLLVPLLIQLPLVMLLGMIWNYQDLNRERKNIQRAFGYYLPETEVNRLARDVSAHGLGGQLMHGTCLSTDAQQYTRLSEKMSPQQLSDFMNAYYDSIFRPVRESAGIISDVVGDSVMALWASTSENLQQRQQAVTAAIRIIDSVAEFNQQHPGDELPTRIGLHYGVMVIGNVGAVDHYEYRAVGDIVNTSSRIEGMNKYLGVRLLASADVLEGLQGIEKRFVGRFILKGKTVDLALYEIAASDGDDSSARSLLWQQFSGALTLFQQGLWQDASAAFALILKDYADDGPARFYYQYCEDHQCVAPENWQGVLRMQEK